MNTPPLDEKKPEELSFGQNKDDFDSVPTPPSQFKDEQKSDAEPSMTKSLMSPSETDLHEKTPVSNLEASLEDPVDVPLENPNATSQDDAGVPNIPMPDFGQAKEAEAAPVEKLTEQVAPQETSELDVPDLPSLPKEALEGAIDLPEEPTQSVEEITPPTEPVAAANPFLGSVEDVKEQPSSFDPEKPSVEKTNDAPEEELVPGFASQNKTATEQKLDEEPAQEAPVETVQTPLPTLGDETGDTPAERMKYLPEHKEFEPGPEDYYVDSHEFYEVLQDIKAVKKTVKTNDSTMKDIETGIDTAEAKAESLIGAVDDIQEKLIAIDTGLFER